MKTTNLDKFQDKLSALVDEHFPKGKSKERGQAIVLVACALIEAKQFATEQRLVELDLLEQALNAGIDLQDFKTHRLLELTGNSWNEED